MKYKLSRFNIMWEENNLYYISNTLTRSVIKITEEYYNLFKSQEIDRILGDDEIAQKLKEEGVIVDFELDELGMLRYSHEQSKRATDSVEIVFAPTLACNFNCTYCFETPREGVISADKEDEVLEYIINEVVAIDCKKIRFIWFGGEPLLCCEIIERFTKKLRKMCDGNGIQLELSLITNGYLLSRENIRMLEDVGILHIQITIDGCKEIHDSRRKLISGSGTFDRIINNLSYFSGSKIDVAIRVNLNEDNIDQFRVVSELIDNMNIPNLKCHPALVEKTENQDAYQQKKCIASNNEDYYMIDCIKKYYYNKCRSIDNVSCACSAEHINSMVIDEKGNVYKCWNSIGYDDQIYKKTYDKEYINPVIVSAYLGRDPFTEEECNECEYLPICAGGCLYHWMSSKHHKCTPEKFFYKQLILENL